uniref:Uncharacterized protein n=1 Tax=Nelumbo nucifera TaxID=4432 RepID=A0A822Z838_NELNU|nr:TPA_asm: hypothetical protein HUJ06_015555 [Nelumbo nucifera]
MGTEPGAVNKQYFRALFCSTEAILLNCYRDESYYLFMQPHAKPETY